jgi:hypothetical protein
MTMDHPPLAVLAPIYVRHTDPARTHGSSVERDERSLVTHVVREVVTDTRRDDLETEVAAVGERLATSRKLRLTASVPLGATPSAPNTVTGSFGDHVSNHNVGSPPCMASPAAWCRGSVASRNSSVSLTTSSL